VQVSLSLVQLQQMLNQLVSSSAAFALPTAIDCNPRTVFMERSPWMGSNADGRPRIGPRVFATRSLRSAVRRLMPLVHRD
jgi:hypothetical protein